MEKSISIIIDAEELNEAVGELITKGYSSAKLVMHNSSAESEQGESIELLGFDPVSEESEFCREFDNSEELA
jgi:hypothetical protein